MKKNHTQSDYVMSMLLNGILLILGAMSFIGGVYNELCLHGNIPQGEEYLACIGVLILALWAIIQKRLMIGKEKQEALHKCTEKDVHVQVKTRSKILHKK